MYDILLGSCLVALFLLAYRTCIFDTWHLREHQMSYTAMKTVKKRSRERFNSMMCLASQKKNSKKMWMNMHLLHGFDWDYMQACMHELKCWSLCSLPCACSCVCDVHLLCQSSDLVLLIWPPEHFNLAQKSRIRRNDWRCPFLTVGTLWWAENFGYLCNSKLLLF
jgi:hypothetical protein